MLKKFIFSLLFIFVCSTNSMEIEISEPKEEQIQFDCHQLKDQVQKILKGTLDVTRLLRQLQHEKRDFEYEMLRRILEAGGTIEALFVRSVAAKDYGIISFLLPCINLSERLIGQKNILLHAIDTGDGKLFSIIWPYITSEHIKFVDQAGETAYTLALKKAHAKSDRITEVLTSTDISILRHFFGLEKELQTYLELLNKIRERSSGEQAIDLEQLLNEKLERIDQLKDQKKVELFTISLS